MNNFTSYDLDVRAVYNIHTRIFERPDFRLGVRLEYIDF